MEVVIGMLEVTMLDDLETEVVDVLVGVVFDSDVFDSDDDVVATDELELEVVTGTLVVLVELAVDVWVRV